MKYTCWHIDFMVAYQVTHWVVGSHRVHVHPVQTHVSSELHPDDRCECQALFSVRGGRKSKQTWGHFPSTTDGKEEHADAIFRPCRRKSMCSKRHFPSLGMENWASLRLLSVRHRPYPWPQLLLTLVKINLARIFKVTYIFCTMSRIFCKSSSFISV